VRLFVGHAATHLTFGLGMARSCASLSDWLVTVTNYFFFKCGNFIVQFDGREC
jgi:hypothetical protein